MTDTIVPWASGGLSTIPFASFAWAVKRHFARPGPMPRAMLALSTFSGLAYATFLTLLFGRTITPLVTMVSVGQILFCLATMMFWWAIGATSTAGLRIAYQDGDAVDIVSNGPYALVRHPFYLSYMLFWIGTALIAGGWQWVPALALIAWYVLIARSEERRLALSEQGASYKRYSQRTGMLFPSVWRRPP